MPSLMLIRAQSLQQLELQYLPHPCVPIINGHTKIVYAELDGLSTREQFKLLYKLGQVVKGAEVVYHDPSVPLPETASFGNSNPPRFAYPVVEEGNVSDSEDLSNDILDADILDADSIDADIIDENDTTMESAEAPAPDFWQLVEDKAYDDAYALIEQIPPNWPYEKRIKVLTFLDEEDPMIVCFACRVILLLGWRSNVVRVRRLLHKDNPDIKKAALRVIGEFAGASLLPAVQILLNDSDPEVAIVAKQCYQKIKRR